MAATPPGGRLDGRPSQLIDRSSVLHFTFGGRRIAAHPGDTIASALYASGVRVYSRSFKYHRPRGLLCVAGHCPNCLLTVDGVPNVRACTEPARAGMDVRHQNAWPSLDRDVFSVLDRFDRLMPVGFYYKALHKPRFAWRLAAPIISRVAGLGSVRLDGASEASYHHENRHADVAVVGGGAAGMAAALAAASAGVEVVLIDDQTTLGGQLRGDPDDGPTVAALANEVRANGGIEVMDGATAFGLYEGNLLAVHRGDTVLKLRARQIVVATGSYEIPMTFDRNDLPGVMLSTGAQRLTRLYGVKPGSRAVVVTSGDRGYRDAEELLDTGVAVAAVADSRGRGANALPAVETLQARGVELLTGFAPAQGHGKKRLDGIVVARLVDGRPGTEERSFDCDLVAMSGGSQPAGALLYQAGAASRYDESLRAIVPADLPDGVHAAGSVTGTGDLPTSLEQGRAAGLEAASEVLGGAGVPRCEPAARRSEPAAAEGAAILSAAGMRAKEFVCFCEDVTAKDIAQAVDEGFDDIQTLKRYSTVTMGPCQGKMCLAAFVALAAARTGRDPGGMGLTTSRPPVRPVTLGALAGPGHMPVKRTSIHRKHVELGARMVDLGPWRRAHGYGSPQDEARAVRERVGIIDVSSLGKLDVRGADAPELLDKVYTHRFSDLRVGRVRYGVLCRDDGTILDDGTVTRLADDHYFVTTTTGNLELIEQWFRWWMAGTGACAHITDVTTAYASINVAGPRARETLAKLTGVDLSSRKFRYMRSARGDVAGVPTILLRIGFVGETGWELHFPSEYGEHMWDALMDAGREFGVSPFGVEAQRILRLEKGHVIVNQDTDAVSNPLESGLDWAVRFDKDDFIGRAGLVAARDRGLKNRLVGFVMDDDVVPGDGVPVMLDGGPVGRVTSARLSPTLGRGFGLAWVPVDLAEDGSPIGVRVDGRTVRATIRTDPVYDPEGRRLRE